MLCPNCFKQLVMDGDVYHSDVELDGISGVTGTVTITVVCDDCVHELGEYGIELEIDITNFSVDHEDEEEHWLSVELDDEAFAATDVHKVKHVGASATVKVSCSCGKLVEYSWENYKSPDEIMKWINS